MFNTGQLKKINEIFMCLYKGQAIIKWQLIEGQHLVLV